MDKILVEGKRRLVGEVRIGGAKNAALPILVSALLADGQSVYDNVPKLQDINSVCSLLTHLGADPRGSGKSGTVITKIAVQKIFDGGNKYWRLHDEDDYNT